MRVLIDTNVLISAALSANGVPFQAYVKASSYPRGGCVLAGINSVLGAIDRVCPILHSGPGCCMQTTAAEQGQSGNKNACFVSGVSIPSTNMLERGCME